MKKSFYIILMSLFIFKVNALEIRLNKNITGINKQWFSIHSILEIYNTKNSIYLKCVYFDTFRFFMIDGNSEVYEINEEMFSSEKQNKLETSLKLKYGYKVEINIKLISFENASPNIYGYRNLNSEKGIIPQYFYIKSQNDNIVFNFNTWKIGKKEFFLEEYEYNSLNEKIYYTDEKIERLMKLNATFTQENLCLVNSRKNKIAVVFEGYPNDNCSGLIIFDVLYNATVNDFRVRLRSEPNLKSQVLSYFYEGDKVRILDQSDELYEIDGESHYWYKIESGTYPIGWVYGKYLNIEDCVEEN